MVNPVKFKAHITRFLESLPGDTTNASVNWKDGEIIAWIAYNHSQPDTNMATLTMGWYQQPAEPANA